MLDKSFVEAVEEGARRPRSVEGASGRKYIFVPTGSGDAQGAGGWTLLDLPQKIAAPILLVVRTLTGLVDYLRLNRDKLALADLLVHVETPTSVKVYGPLEGEFRERACFLKAEVPADFGQFVFGRFYEKEAFGIALRTFFEPTDPRDHLIKVTAAVTEGATREIVDDGVAQQVSTMKGVSMKQVSELPSTVILQPFRTFREISPQTPSAFILRAQGGDDDELPSLALFECDGGAWQLGAIRAVADFLKAEIAKVEGLKPVEVIA